MGTGGALREALRLDAPASTWRIAVYTELERILDDFETLEATDRDSPQGQIVETRLREAREALDPYPSGRAWKLFYSGACIEQAWACVHDARRALVMLLPEDTLRARIARLRALVVAHIEDEDERKATLTELETIAAATPLERAERERLAEILYAVDAQSDLYQREVRAFRNLVLIFAGALGLLLVAVAVVHAVDRSLITLCAPKDQALKGDLCVGGGTKSSRFDVAAVEIVGALGGLLAAVIPLARARRLPGPYSLAVAQSGLKVTTGAALALIGVLLLQGGVLAGLQRQPGSHVIAYAVFFGFAQQALTRLIDRRAGELAGAGAAKQDDTAATPTAGTHRSR